MTRRVLIIDDDKDIRELLQFALNQQGCDVRAAESREAALTLIGPAWVPEIILLDYCMAGMGPREFVAHLLRMDSKLPRMVVMTAADAADERARSIGIPEVLRKPFNPAELFNEIEGCVH